MPSLSRQQGFTLLEILAAFLIFSLVFASSLQILSGSMRNTQRAGEYSKAAMWAESRMDSLGVDPPLEEGSYGDELEGGYRWEMIITPYEAEEESGGAYVGNSAFFETPVDMFAIELNIYWSEDDNRPRRAVFKSLRAVTPGVN